MTTGYVPSDQDLERRRQIAQTYNAGELAQALEMAKSFHREFPDNLTAQFLLAVMHGDYSYAAELNAIEKAHHLSQGKSRIYALYHHPDLMSWDTKFRNGVRNEYFWFFEKHEEQYALGLEVLQFSESGHYSACVGASMLTLRSLKEKQSDQIEHWAKIAAHHFAGYEKYDPEWFNINFFAAQALACRGQFEQAVEVYRDTFRKQKAAEKETEMAEFMKKLEQIKILRAAMP